MNKIDFFVAIGLFLFSLFFLWQSTNIPVTKLFAHVSPRIWPQATLLLLCFFSLILLLKSIRVKNQEKELLAPGSTPDSIQTVQSSLGMITCLCGAIALWPLGFFVAFPLFLFVFMYVLGQNIKKPIIICPIATAILGYVFTRIVYVPFPKGIGIFYKINAFFY